LCGGVPPKLPAQGSAAVLHFAVSVIASQSQV